MFPNVEEYGTRSGFFSGRSVRCLAIVGQSASGQGDLDGDEVCVTVPQMDGELTQVVGVSVHVVGPDIALEQEILTGLVSAGANSANNLPRSSIQMIVIRVLAPGHAVQIAVLIRHAAVTVDGNDLIVWRHEGGRRVEVARFGEHAGISCWEEEE